MPESQVMTKDELILAEAKRIGIELIEVELGKKDLPLPREAALDLAVSSLLENRPDIIELARNRVDAKTDGYRQSIESLGIEPVIIEALEL